jgi:hypothetical protein
MPRPRPLLLLIAALAVAWTAPGRAAGEPKRLRVYFIGNSVTDMVNYSALAKAVAARGEEMVWGRHMIPGAPMFGMWETSDPALEKKTGFAEKPFGTSREALASYEWDAISLQPFDRRFHNGPADKPQGDLDIAQLYIDLASKMSPHARFYIYSRWPRISKEGKGFKFDKDAYQNAEGQTDLSKLEGIDDFTARWTAPYNPQGWDLTNESREYFEALTQELRKQNPALASRILLVPVGDVMNELHGLMKAGQVPGATTIHSVYADGIHLNNLGRYIVGCTFYATIFQEDPHGFAGDPYGVTQPEIQGLVQNTVWKIVRAHPLAGVGGASTR